MVQKYFINISIVTLHLKYLKKKNRLFESKRDKWEIAHLLRILKYSYCEDIYIFLQVFEDIRLSETKRMTF